MIGSMVGGGAIACELGRPVVVHSPYETQNGPRRFGESMTP